MAELITPLVMCGGAGTRLWPASREGRPKQFLQLFGPQSTFQATIKRVSDASLFARPIIVTNAQYRFLVAEQLAAIEVQADILLEPERRDSGPAIAAGAVFAKSRDGDPLMLALAADHVVPDASAFAQACRAARDVAAQGRIVTFGVRPTSAATGYGYVQPGEKLSDAVMSVARFVEKPDAATAQKYVDAGYLWNSGNFLFRASVLLAEYSAFEAASIDHVTAAVSRAQRDLGFVSLDKDEFAQAKATSIDYAVMERTKRAATIPVSYAWSDVGSWQAVWELSAQDKSGNAAQGLALFEASKNSYVLSEKALVSLFGVENVVVVATEDAILVARHDSDASMRDLVSAVKKVAPKTTEDHLRVHRPWGSYQSLDQGGRYQVKRIVVKPAGRLSLQKHQHRSEHWVVVHGTARVTIGENVQTLHENESVYIPIGSIHRLENPGKIDLELIEVQTGSYLGEDDIVRLEDDYRRD